VKHFAFLTLVGSITLAACAFASAQIQPTFDAGEAGNPFAKGTWDFQVSGTYIQPIRFSRTRMYNLNVGGGYYVWDGTSANIELQGYYADQPNSEDNALIGGIFILGRTHLLYFDRWSIFVDGGGGVSYADHEVPEFGTNFNFTAKVGLGATYEFADHTFLIGGARYFHLSNGQIRGRDDNPSYDGVQFWGGVMWTW
jgi:opacity protein-like surface antigen